MILRYFRILKKLFETSFVFAFLPIHGFQGFLHLHKSLFSALENDGYIIFNLSLWIKFSFEF
jgi:hypothetical protein